MTKNNLKKRKKLNLYYLKEISLPICYICVSNMEPPYVNKLYPHKADLHSQRKQSVQMAQQYDLEHDNMSQKSPLYCQDNKKASFH